MVLKVSPLDWIRFALGAGDRVLVTQRIMDFNHVLEGGDVGLAVITGKPSFLALFILVGGDVTTLKPLPALVHAFYLHELTPVRLITRSRILSQMFF